ncbi:MAG: ATP phosphoribosyltransferase regulatory subunit, partial [Alphaproteobacteria bacterium]|nr:ATP phosphoribosyltransferase regulatory subunit [Alphaproteobacteria bacterium]
IWELAGVEPVGGRSASEIVHRLAERAALAQAPRLSPSQADLFGAYMAITGAPDAALDEVQSLVGGKAPALAAAREAWRRRVEAMVGAGVPAEVLRFSTAFGRAFGYYDGAIFEIRSEALGPDQAVAAGGRYDGLAARLGATISTGAVGAMVRPGRAWVGA